MIRTQRPGFTLLEMMISIVIFSLITVYLYQSLDTLRHSNTVHAQKLEDVDGRYRITKTLFLDLSLASAASVEPVWEDAKTDTLFLQTSHSLHQRIMPYVAYTLKDGYLYRTESPERLPHPLEIVDNLIVDKLAAVDVFRIYYNKPYVLVHIRFKGEEEQLMKVRVLN